MTMIPSTTFDHVTRPLPTVAASFATMVALKKLPSLARSEKLLEIHTTCLNQVYPRHVVLKHLLAMETFFSLCRVSTKMVSVYDLARLYCEWIGQDTTVSLDHYPDSLGLSYRDPSWFQNLMTSIFLTPTSVPSAWIEYNSRQRMFVALLPPREVLLMIKNDKAEHPASSCGRGFRLNLICDPDSLIPSQLKKQDLDLCALTDGEIEEIFPSCYDTEPFSVQEVHRMVKPFLENFSLRPKKKLGSNFACDVSEQFPRFLGVDGIFPRMYFRPSPGEAVPLPRSWSSPDGAHFREWAISQRKQVTTSALRVPASSQLDPRSSAKSATVSHMPAQSAPPDAVLCSSAKSQQSFVKAPTALQGDKKESITKPQLAKAALVKPVLPQAAMSQSLQQAKMQPAKSVFAPVQRISAPPPVGPVKEMYAAIVGPLPAKSGSPIAVLAWPQMEASKASQEASAQPTSSHVAEVQSITRLPQRETSPVAPNVPSLPAATGQSFAALSGTTPNPPSNASFISQTFPVLTEPGDGKEQPAITTRVSVRSPTQDTLDLPLLEPAVLSAPGPSFRTHQKYGLLQQSVLSPRPALLKLSERLGAAQVSILNRFQGPESFSVFSKYQPQRNSGSLPDLGNEEDSAEHGFPDVVNFESDVHQTEEGLSQSRNIQTQSPATELINKELSLLPEASSEAMHEEAATQSQQLQQAEDPISSFSEATAFQENSKEVVGLPRAMFLCPACERCFCSKRGLKQHQKRQHEEVYHPTNRPYRFPSKRQKKAKNLAKKGELHTSL